MKKINKWPFWVTSWLLGDFVNTDHKTPADVMEFIINYYGKKHSSGIEITTNGTLKINPKNAISDTTLIKWVECVDKCVHEGFPYMEKYGYYVPFIHKNPSDDDIWGKGFNDWIKDSKKSILNGEDIPIPPNKEWYKSNAYNLLNTLHTRYKLLGK